MKWRAYAANRADEREAPPIGGLDVVRCWKMDMAHAEAVAARLVEVIGQQHVALAAERRYIEEVDRALAGRTAEVEAVLALAATEGGRVVNAPDEIIFNGRRAISHMTAREKEIYRYGYLAAGIKIAADIEAQHGGTMCYRVHPIDGTPLVVCSHERDARIARGES